MKRQNDRSEAKDRLRGLFDDLVSEPGQAGIIGFAKHIGMPLSIDDQGSSWWPLFLARYMKGKAIDEERVALDLATFPPIARIVELTMKNRDG